MMKNPYVEAAAREAVDKAQRFQVPLKPGLPDVEDPLASAQDDAVTLACHVKNTLDALVSMGRAIVGASTLQADELGSGSRRSLYVLANHLGKLHKRTAEALKPKDVALVRKVLERFGVENWYPTERLAWCMSCGFEPLYTLLHPNCGNCGWMICPSCSVCRVKQPCEAPKGDTGK